MAGQAEDTQESRRLEVDQRFEKLADSIPQMVWSTDAGGAVDYVNRRWAEFTGEPPASSMGNAWMRFLHPEDVISAAAAWTRAVQQNACYEIEYRLRHHQGEHRWVLARGEPVTDASGKAVRWIGTCTDIHQQKADAERFEVLSQELSHRIKNIFAVIGGLVTMSIRARPELHESGKDLHDRIMALGRAHDFVRPHSERSRRRETHNSLVGMLESLLEPYVDAQRGNVAINGADVAIDDRSATPLGLFFHELATNAAKYGALSAETGRVAIDIEHGDEGVTLIWQEENGPPVRAPSQSGFGFRLIDISIRRQLNGIVDYEWMPEGLRVSAHIRHEVLQREPLHSRD